MSREEDDAVALVRVYCGLASADLAEPQSSSEVWLTVAVVDDAGRLIDICEVSDDAGGYAELSALLAQRSGGQGGVAVAAESDDHVVTQLLTAAGRNLAFTDDDSADDYAERFADDESPEEIQSNAAERRAVGLARALQAGVLSAVGQSPPRDMLTLKPVLAAHGAVVAGRQSAAATLREVLRELYPAALRAYPDPAEAIPLAILDALPEPGILGGGAAGRNRDAQVANELAISGVADAGTLGEAITALRVAIAETPRRTGVNRALTAAVAETIRQSVAAVRACDAAAASLVGVLAEKMSPARLPGRQRTGSPLTPVVPLRSAPAVSAAGTLGSVPTVGQDAPPTRTRVAARAAEVARAAESAAAKSTPAAFGAQPAAASGRTSAAAATGGRRRAQAAPAQAQPPAVSALPAASVAPSHVTSAPPVHVTSAPPAHVTSAPPAHVAAAPPVHVTSAPPSHVVSGPPSYAAVVSGPPSVASTPPATATPPGYQPAAASFGQPVTSTPPGYGQPVTSTPPSYGQQVASAPPAYGQPPVTSTPPGYGQQVASAPPAYGQPAAPTPPGYGVPSTPAAYGVPSTPPAYGVPSTPPAYGVHSTPPAYGVTSTPPAYGVSSTPPAYGVTSTPPGYQPPAAPPGYAPTFPGAFDAQGIPAGIPAGTQAGTQAGSPAAVPAPTPQYQPAAYQPPTPTYAPAPPIPPTYQQQPIPASMQSIPVPLQAAPPQPVPVAPLPVAPAPVAPPPVAPAPVIPPPAASEQPTFASLMPTPPPGIAPLLADSGFDFTRPSSVPPAPVHAAQESDSGSIRLSDLSSLGEPPSLDPATPAPGSRTSSWPRGGPDTSSAFDGDPLNMTTSAFATEIPSATSAFSSDLSSLPSLSDIPKPPAELSDLETGADFGRRSSGRTEHSELLNRSELSRSELGRSELGRSELGRSERSRADRSRADHDPLNRSDLSAPEAESAAEPTRGRRASRTDDAAATGRTEGRRSARAEAAAAAEPVATPRAERARTEIPRSERARTEIPRSERSRTETPRTETPRTEAPRTETPRTEIPRSERSRAERPVELPRQREGRVPPPWQTGDLPAEPAGLRLVEPAPVPDPALSGYADELSGEYSGEFRFEPPALRLVEDRPAERATARSSGTGAGRSRRAAAAEATASASVPAKPADEADGDLLIFAAARSAWFTDWDADAESETPVERPEVNWDNQNDSAWRLAEEASQPKLGDETSTGLPRRVPQQNLVPGSPINSPERPLRIVRDAAQIAAHTTGYFRGWRRGQEVGGFAVGGRPGREAAGGWDFSREREASREYQEREFEYRSARR